MLNGTVSFPKWVVLIQPCAWNDSSSNSLKLLERHETAVREECYKFFCPLKWTVTVGPRQRTKDAIWDVMFRCGSFSKWIWEWTGTWTLLWYMSCRVLCSAVPRTDSGFFRTEGHAEPWRLCSGVALLEMRWEWCPMPFSCLLSLSLWLEAPLPSWRKLLPNSMVSREDLECWISFFYYILCIYF